MCTHILYSLSKESEVLYLCTARIRRFLFKFSSNDYFKYTALYMYSYKQRIIIFAVFKTYMYMYMYVVLYSDISQKFSIYNRVRISLTLVE